MSDDAEYGLLVSFAHLYPTDAEERAFVHGYETGSLWERMTHKQEFNSTVHAENETVIRRMCAAKGIAVAFAPTSPPIDGWLVASFTPLPRRGHLAIVK